MRLRALWALYGWSDVACAIGLSRLLRDANEHVRTWAVRLLTDHLPLDTATGLSRAEGDDRRQSCARSWCIARSTIHRRLVRLALASTLQRLPIDVATKAGRGAVGPTAEDAGDHNLPAMIWFGLIPLAERRPELLMPLAI